MMKALGYQRLVSIENFRKPNFELCADVLFWLVYRYDPASEISDDISTEDKRIAFLQNVAQIVYSKARIKLNIKQLYKADGHAVRELLKIATILYDAILTQQSDVDTSSGDALATKLEDLKHARNLATEIVDSGAKLYTLLGKEEELKKSRERALQFLDSISLNLESNDSHDQIERNIMQQINIISDNITDLEQMCGDLDKDQKSLKAKIERKQMDLERADKRYNSLKKVRPAFMEEYDVMERELKQVYETYLQRFRNLQYLESELHKYRKVEMEKKQESDRALSRMRGRLEAEELRILRGEQEVDETRIDDDVFDSGGDSSSGSSDDDMPRKGRASHHPKVQGSMLADSSGEDSEGDSSSSSGDASDSGSASGSDDSDDDGSSEDDGDDSESGFF